jgi:hypothetical protein
VFFRKTVLGFPALEPYVGSDNTVRRVQNVIWINWRFSCSGKLNFSTRIGLKLAKLYPIKGNLGVGMT